MRIPQKGETGIILADEKSDLKEMRALLKRFEEVGIASSPRRRSPPRWARDVKVATIEEMVEMVSKGKVAFVISLNTNLNKMRKDLYKVRRKAVELRVPFLTTLEEGEAILMCVQSPLTSLSLEQTRSRNLRGAAASRFRRPGP